MSSASYELMDPEGQRLHCLMALDGYPLVTFRLSPEERGSCILALRDWQIKEDDVILCTYPKSGTNWVQQIMVMLLNGNPDMSEATDQVSTMMEASSIDMMDTQPSPRILNSHLQWKLLPKSIPENKNKVVVVMRNPKDVAVSYYYHLKYEKDFEYDGQFKFFLDWFLEGKVPYGCFFDSVKEYERLADEHNGQFHILYYEDLKTNGKEEVKRLARFLGTNDADDFCKAVYDACDIKKLKAKNEPKEVLEKWWKPGGTIYRKGIIGDWKMHLTVAQNEHFDRVIEEKMKDSKIKFRYE